MKNRIIAIVGVLHVFAFSIFLVMTLAGASFGALLPLTLYTGVVGIGTWFYFVLLRRNEQKAEEYQREVDEFNAKKAAEKKEAKDSGAQNSSDGESK